MRTKVQVTVKPDASKDASLNGVMLADGTRLSWADAFPRR